MHRWHWQRIAACYLLLANASIAYADDWQRINIGGGGAMNSAAAGPTGTVVATTDLAGAYIKRSSNAQWQMIGPQNGLRNTHVVDVAFDPLNANVLLLATEGGLFRTENEGATFVRVDRLSTTAPDYFGGKYLALAIAPSTQSSPAGNQTSQRVYASRVSRYNVADSRLLRSDDGGQSFRFMADLPRPMASAITKIVVHPGNPDRLLVLSNTERFLNPVNALYMSNDGGGSWFEIGTELENIIDVVFHPLPPHKLFVSSKPSFASAEIHTSNLDTVVNPGSDSWQAIFTTPDYGNRFYQPTLILWPDASESDAIRAINIRTVWQFSTQSAWRITRLNDSENWQVQALGQSSDWTGDESSWQLGWSRKFSILAPTLESVNHTIGFDQSNPDSLLWATNQFVHRGTQVSGGNGLTLAFENLATTGSNTTGWSSQGLDNITPFILEVNPANPAVIYAGLNDVGCKVSRDAGNNWNLCVHNSGDWLEGFDFTESYGGVTTALVSDPTNAAKVWMFAAGDQSDPVTPRVSTDYGENWVALNWQANQPSTQDIYGLSLDPNSPVSSRQLFVTVDGAVFRSQNGGDSWSEVFRCAAGCRVTNVAGLGYVYAAGEAGFYVSKNAGTNWIQVLPASSIDGFFSGEVFKRGQWAGISGIAVDPNNPAIVYLAAFSTEPTQGIFRCDVSAATPTENDCQRVLTNIPFIRDVAVDPFNSTTLYAASSSADTAGGYRTGSAGVLRSTDGGDSWQEFNTGLDWPMAYVLAVDPQNSNVLYTGSPGGGYYKRNINEELADCSTALTLPSNQWLQISLPCNPGANRSPEQLFGDDGLGEYGTDWIMYQFDADMNRYVDATTSDGLVPGTGYWITQITGSPKVLDLPATSTPTTTTTSVGCSAARCAEVSLSTETDNVQWNMLGYPFPNPGQFDSLRVVTATGSCTSGCTLGEASTLQISNDILWTYSGSGPYTAVNQGQSLNAWSGYWQRSGNAAAGVGPVTLTIPER